MSLAQTALPPAIQNLIQQRVLDRMFHENLFPRLLFRSEAMPELWPAQLGEVKVFTRPGLLSRVTEPLVPGVDPDPQSFAFEQWVARASQYGSAIDTHMPTSSVSLASLFLRNIQELGKQAGLSMNALARNVLFRAYLAGDTVAIDAATSGATTLHVASINGFTEKMLDGTPSPVSNLNPLDITFSVAEPANRVVAAIPDDPKKPFGPGTVQLQTALSTNLVVARTGVYAANRSRITKAAGAATVDGISGSTPLTLQDLINAVAQLRADNVPPTPDGYYHVHVTPEGEAQLYADQQFRQLFQSLPDTMVYRDLAIGQLIGCRFYRNTELPGLQTVSTGGLSTTSANGFAKESNDIGGEVVNNAGFQLKYAIVIGGGSIYEPYIDESRFISEAGVTGKIGEFNVTNGGVSVMTERIRLTIRSPLDRLQQVVSAAWSWSGDFAVPSDELTGATSRFKRARVIIHG